MLSELPELEDWPEAWADAYALELRVAALSDAIAWTYARLRDAGATHRGAARRAVSAVDAYGEDSEDEVSRLWRELRELGHDRRAARDELRRIRA